MKHDRSRRHSPRHSDPSVICLPSQLPPHTPPRREPEVTGATDLPDDIELLAHKNIFEGTPRVSRQARRKALRAEKKAAHRAATERFLAGAPSLREAADQFEAVQATARADDDIPMLARELDALIAAEADVRVGERAEAEPEALPGEAALQGEAGYTEPRDIKLELAAVEALARLISENGPLIVPAADNDIEAEEAAEAPSSASLLTEAPPAAEPVEASEPQQMAATEPAAPGIDPSTEEESPVPAWMMDRPAKDAMMMPLPRNRALVAHKRNWLLRLIPWRGLKRKAPPAEPALVQLQELRFELVNILHRLDKIIDQSA